MAPKKESKGDFVKFIRDAANDPNLHKKMMDVINKKGKGETPDTLLKKFHGLGYYGVSLQDCNTALFMIKEGIRDPSGVDWTY